MPVTMRAKPIQVQSWKVQPVTDRHQNPCSPETGLQPGLYMELEGPDHTPLSCSTCRSGSAAVKGMASSSTIVGPRRRQVLPVRLVERQYVYCARLLTMASIRAKLTV